MPPAAVIAQTSLGKFGAWYCCLAPLGFAAILLTVYAIVRWWARRSEGR